MMLRVNLLAADLSSVPFKRTCTIYAASSMPTFNDRRIPLLGYGNVLSVCVLPRGRRRIDVVLTEGLSSLSIETWRNLLKGKWI